MPQFLFDTDHLTLHQYAHPQLKQRLASQPADAVAISAVTIAEAMRGRLTALSRHRRGPLQLQAYAKLVATVELINEFPIVGYDQASENHYHQLVALRLRVGTHDLKIAAVALANNLTLLTRNRRDFARIPGLVLTDWSV
jgi:tRNA(fMet)-specific endonuclease VapC